MTWHIEALTEMGPVEATICGVPARGFPTEELADAVRTLCELYAREHGYPSTFRVSETP